MAGILDRHGPQLPRRAHELAAGQRGTDGADGPGLGEEAVGQVPLGLLLQGPLLDEIGDDLVQIRPGGREAGGHLGQQLLPRQRFADRLGGPGQAVAGDLQAKLRKLRIAGIIGQEPHGQGRRPLPFGQAPPVADHRPGSRRGPAAAVGVSAYFVRTSWKIL